MTVLCSFRVFPFPISALCSWRVCVCETLCKFVLVYEVTTFTPAWDADMGCVVPSVKDPTCREYAMALLTQQEEREYKLQLWKVEENQLLQRRVKNLEEKMLRIQVKIVRLAYEVQKCKEHQALELQKGVCL